MRKVIPLFLAVILLILFMYLGISLKESEHRFALEGKPAPNFTLKTPDGKTVSLKDFRGKVVLVNFWATWCPPCREEMPLFEEIYQKYKDKGFVILAINTDPENLENFENVYSFTILIGNDEVVNAYNVMGLPTSYLIDRNGVIVKVRRGIYRELEKDLKSLLEK